jgi:hypothetical protein
MGTAAATAAAASAATSLVTVKVLPYRVTGVVLGIKPNPFIVGIYIIVNPEFANVPN